MYGPRKNNWRPANDEFFNQPDGGGLERTPPDGLPESADDPLAPMRGILWGCLFSIPIYALVFWFFFS